MLRLSRTSKKDLTPAQLQQSQNTLALLKKHALPSVEQFFAVPIVTNNEQIDWLSHHSGQIKTFQSLSETEQEKLLELANQHIKTVQLLQKALQKEGKLEEAKLLAPLTVEANSEYLYAVDGKAVYTHWLNVVAPQASSTAVPPLPVSSPVAAAPVVEASKKWRWLWLLLLLLLLIFLLGLATWYWFKAQPPQTLDEPLAIIQPSSHSFGSKFACQAEAVDPPEFTIIFDTSGSMVLNVHTTQEEEDWYYSTEFTTLKQLQKAAQLEQSPSRLAVAKNAMQHMIHDLHPQVPARLLSFETCGEVTNHGIFATNRRADLLSTLLGLETRGGTPSGQALFFAAQQMDGVDKDGIIILVIDGEDGCEMSLCQMADLIAQTKPRIRVNVVDITGFGLSNCAANKTGGRVYSSNNIEEINQMMRDSIEEVATNPTCPE